MKITTLGTSHGTPTATRFCSSILLEENNFGYLLDAGEPVSALLIRRNYDFSKLKLVVVSHMHLDHCAGLPDLIRYIVKYHHSLQVFLPEAEAADIIAKFVEMGHTSQGLPGIKFHTYQAGVFFQDENICLTAYPTRHIQEGLIPSFAITASSISGTLLYTGDLTADLSDFPAEAAKNSQLCICELTHCKTPENQKKFALLPVRRMIFTHIGSLFQGEGADMRFEALRKSLPYPAEMAHDGSEYLL